MGKGFWIRFTVQFILFAGTVLAIGNEVQIDSMNDMQAKVELGCFGPTEKFAGVSSGMVVESIAEVDLQTREFILTSPNEGAYSIGSSRASRPTSAWKFEEDGVDEGGRSVSPPEMRSEKFAAVVSR